MWKLNYFLSFSYLIIFVSCSLILVHIFYINKIPSLNSNLLEYSILFTTPLPYEKNFFNQSVQRLLHTHAMNYNDSSVNCISYDTITEKNQNILDGVARLLPQLRDAIVPYPHGHYKGQGIVLTVGPKQLLHTKFNLRIMAWTQTKLPIEVWYSSAQISRITINQLLMEVPSLNIKACCFEAAQCHYYDGDRINIAREYIYSPFTKNLPGKIFSFKPAAILSSTFAEVLFLDSDCYLVRDPLYLFLHDPMYQKFGVLFYPDIYASYQHSLIWVVLNSFCVRYEFSLDSGVLLFDKRRVWNGIYLAKLMSHHPEIFYVRFFSDGDKDTFRLAFRYLKIPYYIVGIPCSTGYITNTSFCGVTLCKTDSLGLNVYFDHVHHPKHSPELTFTRKNFTHTRIALADPNDQAYTFAYCMLHPLPCFQVGFKFFGRIRDYCQVSALHYYDRSLVKMSSNETVLWNPNNDTKLLLMKKTEETMPGYIDFYFKTQEERIFKGAKL